MKGHRSDSLFTKPASKQRINIMHSSYLLTLKGLHDPQWMHETSGSTKPCIKGPSGKHPAIANTTRTLCPTSM